MEIFFNCLALFQLTVSSLRKACVVGNAKLFNEFSWYKFPCADVWPNDFLQEPIMRIAENVVNNLVFGLWGYIYLKAWSHFSTETVLFLPQNDWKRHFSFSEKLASTFIFVALLVCSVILWMCFEQGVCLFPLAVYVSTKVLPEENASGIIAKCTIRPYLYLTCIFYLI